MKPYAKAVSWALACVLALGSLPALAAGRASGARPRQQGEPLPAPKRQLPPTPAAPAAWVPVRLQNNEVVRRAFEHFYNQEYERAVRYLEQVAAAHPEDPFAANYLLTALLFGEMHRIGALNTGLYSNNTFLDSKPVPPDPAVKKRIRELMEQAEELSDQRLKKNPRDVLAFYARGVTKGLRATYMGMVEKSWFGALRAAIGSRRDHEKVLELDAGFTDAKMAVGIHNYIVGSLPWATKVAVALVGISGNKKKGLEYLYEAARGDGEASVDARIALSLFLRREERYLEALQVVRSLAARYPRSFLFAVEVPNVLNDMGRADEAIAGYNLVLQRGRQAQYSAPRLEFAAYGLGEALSGQQRFVEAARAFEMVRNFTTVDTEFQQRALVSAGRQYDIAGQREAAVERYRDALASGPADTEPAKLARKYLKTAYRPPKNLGT